MVDAAGKLYLVPTPIGNIGDISNRALETLSEVDLVACEDTRVTGRLFSLLGLKKKLISYHEFNESSRAKGIQKRLLEGESVAVVTDAGSPGISDPSYRVVRVAIDTGIEVVALPGPTAIIPALTASGLPTDRFFYEGFLPPKSAARRKRLEKLKEYEHTLVFYESPHRIEKSLTAMLEVLGDRPACLAREISKKFEEYRRGFLSVLLRSVTEQVTKGEMVVVVAGNNPKLLKSADLPDED
jgi:16S rRNA (cytidine1402-2'-O)-methyltransferase